MTARHEDRKECWDRPSGFHPITPVFQPDMAENQTIKNLVFLDSQVFNDISIYYNLKSGFEYLKYSSHHDC